MGSGPPDHRATRSPGGATLRVPSGNSLSSAGVQRGRFKTSANESTRSRPFLSWVWVGVDGSAMMLMEGKARPEGGLAGFDLETRPRPGNA